MSESLEDANQDSGRNDFLMADNGFEEKLREIAAVWRTVLDDFFHLAEFKQGQILVFGCSTSEVLGRPIGQGSSAEVAEVLLPPLLEQIRLRDAFLAVQGCQHLNRALVVEEACAERYGLEQVLAVPALNAGGAMAVQAWNSFVEPLMVERIQGHGGIDVGDTFIGMHLRPVVVPVRTRIKELGGAHLTFAHTRPRYIGGPRAVYTSNF